RLTRDFINGWIMSEGTNPTRRYKSSRPRQMARIGYQSAGIATASNIELFNNSNGAEYLVVRRAFLASGTGARINGVTRFGTIGSKVADPAAVVAGDAIPPGQLFFLDGANPASFDQTFLPIANNYVLFGTDALPMVVLPPQWGYIFFVNDTGQLLVSLIYEHIFSDELDFFFT